jgi:hypothetical protein
MTREQIEALKIGDELERTLDTIAFTEPSRVKPNARWGCRGKITSIHARGVSVKGHVYVCGYTSFGENGATMSFSLSEGEEFIRHVPVELSQAG